MPVAAVAQAVEPSCQSSKRWRPACHQPGAAVTDDRAHPPPRRRGEHIAGAVYATPPMSSPRQCFMTLTKCTNTGRAWDGSGMVPARLDQRASFSSDDRQPSSLSAGGTPAVARRAREDIGAAV